VDEVPGEIVEPHAQAPTALFVEPHVRGRIAPVLREDEALDFHESEAARLQPHEGPLRRVVNPPDREDRDEGDGDEGDEEEKPDEEADHEDGGSRKQREEGFHDAHLSFGTA